MPGRAESADNLCSEEQTVGEIPAEASARRDAHWRDWES